MTYDEKFVSILVLMDSRVKTKQADTFQAPARSFNPCFNG